MEFLKSKTTIVLVVMILGVAYIGGVDNSSLEDTNSNPEYNISVNA